MSYGQWYRDIADTYTEIAATATYPLAKSMNATEAAAYYAIADRLDLLDRPTPVGEAV